MSGFTAVYLVYNFVLMLSIERLMGVFFEKRRTSRPVFISSYLLYYALSSIVFLLLNIPLLNVATYIVMLFIIALNYETQSKARRFFAAVSIFVFFGGIDILVSLLLGFYQVDLTQGIEHNMFGFMFMGMSIYIVASLLRKYKNIRKSKISSPVFWVSAITIHSTSIVLTLLAIAYSPQVVAIVSISVLLIINLLVLYQHDILSATYNDKLKSALHAQEKDYYFSQCQLMQQSVEQVKTIRHDMKMHLATVKEYSTKNKTNEITNYVSNLLGDITQNEIYSDTGNIAFDSIINFKLNQAKEQNITPDIRILIPPAVNIEVADIVTILGNLLDNALDALAKVEDRVLQLDIEFSKESLFIKVDNTFDGVVKYAKKKEGDTKHIVTRKDGGNHGHGLKNIMRSIEKYNGHMDIAHEGNVFSVTVILYVDDE